MPPVDRFVSENSFHVRYAETDAMGIVHHASYIVYFEEARSHYSRVRGADYAEFEKTGFVLAVAGIEARYVAPAHYGEVLTARCWVEKLKSRSLVFAYEIINAESEQLLCTGQSSHVCLNHEGRVSRLPEFWITLLKGEG